jgi:hypothetical protein
MVWKLETVKLLTARGDDARVLCRDRGMHGHRICCDWLGSIWHGYRALGWCDTGFPIAYGGSFPEKTEDAVRFRR